VSLSLTINGQGETLYLLIARMSVRITSVPTLVAQCGADPRMVSEMRRLQQRVRDLEAELVRLQEENDALAAGVDHEDDVLLLDREPAYT
jgi:hypothetical protein